MPASYDPADYAASVRTRARRVGVSAQLAMAILYNEAYKPDAAFGIADMHRAAFDEVKKGRDFAGRRWEELPDDRDLAVEAEAWSYLDRPRANWTKAGKAVETG
jgi:hypothetical protein